MSNAPNPPTPPKPRPQWPDNKPAQGPDKGDSGKGRTNKPKGGGS